MIYLYSQYKDTSSNNYFSPSLEKNVFYNKLSHAIQIANIKTTEYVYRDFVNEVEFTLENGTKAILSTKLSPYFQINTLQQVLKKAKIDNKTPRLVNLGAVNPYATF